MDSEIVVGGTGDGPFLPTAEEKVTSGDSAPARVDRKMSPEGDSTSRRNEFYSPSSSRVDGPSIQGMSRRDKRLARELEYNRRRLGEHRAVDARFAKDEVVEPSPISLRYEQRVSDLEDTPLRYPCHEVPPPPCLTTPSPGRIRPGAPLPVPKGWIKNMDGKLVRDTSKARSSFLNVSRGRQVCWNCGSVAGRPHAREDCANRWIARVERGQAVRCDYVFSPGKPCLLPVGHTAHHISGYQALTSEGENAGHNTRRSRWVSFKS